MKYPKLVDVQQVLISMLIHRAATMSSVLTVRNVHRLASKTLRTQMIVEGSIAVLRADGHTNSALTI